MQDELAIIPHETHSKASFLEGGGKLGELIRAYDWEKTPLGAPENWPQSLKTCVRIMLTSRQPIWIGWGKDLIKLYNDPYKAIVGGKHPWALGQPAAAVWKNIWEDIEPMLKTVMEKDEGTYVESQLLIMDRNGYLEETYYTFSYTPIPGDHGGTAGMICANTDDTIRIIGERQLRTLRDLGKSLAKMQTVTEVYQNALRILEDNQKDFPFAVLYKADDDGRTVQAIAYAGIDKDQVVLPTHVDLLNPMDGTFNLCKAFTKKEIVVSENKGRRKNLPKGAWEIEPSHFVHIPIITSGSTFPNAILTAALNPYRIYDETYRQFTTLVADQIALEVNNVMAYEAERKRAEALTEIDKAKTVFFSNISHEFRTPLTLMLGPLEDLLNRTQSHLTDEEKNKIETTHRNSMRLLRLVNNLLDFSRIESGRAKAQFQLTNISAFTKDLAGSFRSAIEDAGLYFTVDCEQIIEPIYVDRSMWEKIVLNLLSNAFKYTLNGGITVSLSIKNKNVELSVRDTGVGIPKEELPNLFQRFHRVQNVTGRTYEGSGIGLSLVSEFVKMHGGKISVTSQVGTGSEFVVSTPSGRRHLPVEQIHESGFDPEVRLADAFLEEAESLIEIPVNKKTNETDKIQDSSYILVVDDNPDMRDYLKNILGRQFTVLTCNNGIEALQTMQEKAPQLVLSDVMMPGMDGIQLLKAIKENKNYERIPVILLTARAGEESRIEGYQIGADDYLVKPFSTKELLARITTQLSTRKRIEETERRLEYFIKQAPVGIVVYKSADFIVEVANDRVLEMWGKTFDDVKGKSLAEIFPEINSEETLRALYRDSVEKFLKGETFIINEAEFTFQRNGQTYKGWYNCTYEPLRDSNGNPTGIIAVVNEVTDQVVARKQIEESEERFRTLATEFPLFVWLTDARLQTTFLNKTGLDYFNLPQNTKVAELSWKKFIHADDLERVLAIMNDAAQHKKSYTLTMRLKNGKTGKYRWFVDNGVPQYINEKFTGFIGTSMDIDEQKTADEKIRQSEERFRFLFDSNVLPVAFWHISGEIYDANDSFLNLMGYTREEMQQGKLSWRKFTRQEDAPTHEEKVRQAVEGKTIPPYEAQYVNKNGELISSLVGYAMLTGSKERGIAFMQDIRKIKEVEGALRQSEEKYRQLSMSLEEKVNQRTEELTEKNEQLNQAQQIAQLGNWEWNMGKNEVLWSDEMYSIYGYGQERFTVTIEKATERMLATDAKNVIERMRGYVADARRVFQEKGITVYNNPPSEYSIILPDGSEKILRGGGKIILNEHGEISRIIGTVQDITEQKRVERTIQTINDRLMEAQQIARLGSWEWDTLTGKLSWSQNLYNIYEIGSADGINFEKFMLLVHPDDRKHLEELIASTFNNKRIQDFYHRIITPGGKMKILHGRGELIIDEEGHVAKVIGTAQDVTVEKMMEDKLIETNETLEQRTKFVETLINSSLDLIIVIDRDFRFITLNKKAESVIRSYYPDELIGKKITDLSPFVEQSEAYKDLLRAFDGDIIIRDKVKSPVADNYYEHNYIPLQHASGDIYAVMVISHDITENIRQIEELRKLNEADKLKSDFIKMASHELKTPVTSIKGYTQLLLSALKEQQDKLSPLLVKSSLVSVDKQITRLTRLMSELLDLSKIETGMLVLNKELFHLNELVIETVQDILYTNSKHNINIFHDFECDVYGDKDRLGQVLINFLTNAIKYSPNDDKVEVWIRQSGKNSVSVSVKDFGIGIDEKDHEKIFERFYRVGGKEEQTFPGFGIGLFIAKEIILRHGGTIRLTSEKGKGSTFTFTLPIAGSKLKKDE